jgi:hypothetical protein
MDVFEGRARHHRHHRQQQPQQQQQLQLQEQLPFTPQEGGGNSLPPVPRNPRGWDLVPPSPTGAIPAGYLSRNNDSSNSLQSSGGSSSNNDVFGLLGDLDSDSGPGGDCQDHGLGHQQEQQQQQQLQQLQQLQNDQHWQGHGSVASNRSSSSGSSSGASADAPAFHDLVKRSTRFVTSVPAAEILMGIEDVVCSGALAPQRPPHLAKAVQETLVSWEEFRLDVFWGGHLAYSVHVFLLPDNIHTAQAPNTSSSSSEVLQPQPSYMVEFRRRQYMDIFQFKRYYEAVLEELARHIKRAPDSNKSSTVTSAFNTSGLDVLY